MMKAHYSDENDAGLSQVLQEWKVNTPVPPRFQETVWHRIARGEAMRSSWSSLLWRVTAAFGRPALAASYLTGLVLAGLLAGYVQARVANAHAEAQLSARYVQSIDPYQMPHR